MWAWSDGKAAGQDPRLDHLLHLNHDDDDVHGDDDGDDGDGGDDDGQLDN